MNEFLWRTCRTLANETRLQILHCLLKNEALCVQNVAEIFCFSEVAASRHLKLLNEEGFLRPRRESKWVFYELTIQHKKTYATYLAGPLKKMLSKPAPRYSDLIWTFTSFTHPRRIDIAKNLFLRMNSFEHLITECSIPGLALSRHLNKLIRRNIISEKNGMYRIVKQKTALRKALFLCCEKEPFSYT